MYQEYITININPDTGFSRYFDKNYYSSESKYINMLASAVGKNKIINELQIEILILKAYGVSNAQIINILSIFKPAI